MRSLLVVSICAAANAAVGAVRAAERADYFNFTLGTSTRYESNVFRLPDSADLAPVLGTSRKSDFVSTYSVGIRLDIPWSLQRFQVDVAHTGYRYHTFSFLDFDALDYRAAWLWHLTPRVRGILSAERRETLVPLEDVATLQRALRVAENRVFAADAWLFGGWHLLAGASHYRQSDTRVIVPEQGFEATTLEGGVSYVARSGSSVALVRRGTKGSYDAQQPDFANLIDTGFREDQSELRVNWLVTDRSTVRARATWVDRRHDHFAQRDFDGLAGEAAFVWRVTDRVRLDAAATRSFIAWWEPAASYRVSNAVTLGATWQVRPRTSIAAELARVQRDYRGPVAPVAGPLREERERLAGIAVNWAPVRPLTVRSSVQRRSRDSNLPGRDFRTTVAEISVSLVF
jgi:exopolysaccharide biosynthesis operon protein EpsL